MRVAIAVLVALAALAGSLPAFAGCSSGSAGGGTPSPDPSNKIVNPVLELLGLPPLGGSTTTNITSNTTNVTNNFFTTAAAEQSSQNATPTKGFGGGGGGGGGGIGGFGGSFSGGSSAGGSPINPSSESSVQMLAAGGSSSSGGGTSGLSDPIALASLSSTPSETPGSVVVTSEDSSSGQPLTPSIALTPLPATSGGADDLMAIAMASPKTLQGGEGFSFEGPASGSPAHASGYAGTTMLAALIGVGMLGAGWAWRSL